MVQHMRLWSVRSGSLLLLLAVLAGLLPTAAAPALAGGGGFVAVPFSSSVPTVDGTCDETEYGDATGVRGSTFTNAPRLKITADNLFVCMAANSSSFRLLVDTNNDSKLDAGDFQVAANLFIIGVAQSNNIRINRYNPATGEFDGPAPGVVEVAMRFIGTTTTAEIRIARATLGDWPRTIGLAMLAVEAGSWPPEFGDKAPATWGSATLVSVPADILRRALNFLEESRAGVSGWANATLDPVPVPFFRPDVDGIAYYEFAVRLPGANAGFILLSSGKHDRPIAHWLAEGNTLSEQLSQQSDGQAVKYFKLDSLYYTAEGNNGQLVAELGQQPPKVTAPATPVDGTGDATPPASQLQQANPNDWNVSYTGIFTTPAALKFEGWGSWNDMKSGYTTTYQPFLAALRQNAAGEWAVEENINQNGIALLKGETYILRYGAGGTTSLSGPGTTLVQTSTPNPNALQITVVNDQPGDPVPFAVKVNYGSTSETVNFAVVASIGRSLIFLPLVQQTGVSTQAAEPATQTQGETQTQATDPNLPPAAPAASSDEVRLQNGDWRFWFADGGNTDQRLYRQLSANTPPNNNNCASGCGPTAWAMLYGWVDVQAQKPGSQWAGKQGIYQVNGGRGTGAAVAPVSNDAGVRNMTMEIRGYVGSLCVGSQAATLPWRMIDAWRYANGRAGMRFRTSWTVPYVGNRADDARNAIVNRRSPAIIGTGFYAHYPMAYGYAERTRRVRRCFIFCWYDNVTDRSLLANQGQGGGGNGWIGYDSWFIGEVFPR